MRGARKKSLGAMGLFVASLGMCLGCGSNLATVEGNVTFDGQPVEQGSIVFEPADGVGQVAGGTIQNGKYRLASEAGVAPGKMIVRISAVKTTGQKVKAGPPAPPETMVDEVSQYIPAIYNEKSTLAIQVAAGNVIQDFELVSQPPPR